MDNKDKAPMSLIPRRALEAEAHAMWYGSLKDGRTLHDWREGMSLSALYDKALRHVVAAIDGEDADPETGQPHEAHARAILGMIIELKDTHPELDDRYKGGRAATGARNWRRCGGDSMPGVGSVLAIRWAGGPVVTIERVGDGVLFFDDTDRWDHATSVEAEQFYADQKRTQRHSHPLD